MSRFLLTEQLNNIVNTLVSYKWDINSEQFISPVFPVKRRSF